MVVQLITTHKSVNMAVTIQTAGTKAVIGCLETGKGYTSIITNSTTANSGKKGIAPFGVRMIGGREAMVHIENGKIVVKNANKNIKVVEVEQ